MKIALFLRMFSLAAIALFSSLITSLGRADIEIPKCMNRNQPILINNLEVLNWKKSTQNGFHGRGFISGTVKKVYPDHSGHDHIEVQIGMAFTDTIEVIANHGFGQIPDNLNVGVKLIACGDYITSNVQAKYPPSPDGAIIHWVHRSDNPSHENGFVVVDGKLYGDGLPGDVAQNDYRQHRQRHH